MSNLKRVSFGYGKRRSGSPDTLHIETPHLLINIRPYLTDSEGRPVTHVSIQGNDFAGEPVIRLAVGQQGRSERSGVVNGLAVRAIQEARDYHEPTPAPDADSRPYFVSDYFAGIGMRAIANLASRVQKIADEAAAGETSPIESRAWQQLSELLHDYISGD